MVVERTFQMASALLVALTTMFSGQTILAQKGTPISQAKELQTSRSEMRPRDAALKKGTAHVGCVYMIYLTIQSVIETCYPDKYIDLHRHVNKWISIMHKYSDENAAGEKQKFGTIEEQRNMQKYRQRLNDPKECEQVTPFIENFSTTVTDHPSETEKDMEELLRQSDDPHRNYGCL